MPDKSTSAAPVYQKVRSGAAPWLETSHRCTGTVGGYHPSKTPVKGAALATEDDTH